MNRRSGITLIEVLASIFIAGIGLLALLTLFPLGALKMAQSIRDDRMGHIKHDAHSVFNAFDVRIQTIVRDGMLNPGGSLTSFYLPGSSPPQVDPSLGFAPSYPVIVDPLGYNFTPASFRQDWVGGIPPGPPGPQPPGAAGTVPRRVSFAPMGTPPATKTLRGHTLEWMTLTDDIRFRDDGTPAGVFLRTYGYSWAYLCKMPRASSGVVEMSVIVYKGRPIDADATNGEAAYAATFDTTNNTVIISWAAGQATPDVAAGNWVLDGTMTPTPAGEFYRVLSVTQLNATTMGIEVQQPLRRAAGATPGVLVIMDGVIGVFPRGTY